MDGVRSEIAGTAALLGFSDEWPMRDVALRGVRLAAEQRWECEHVRHVTAVDVWPPLPPACVG